MLLALGVESGMGQVAKACSSATASARASAGSTTAASTVVAPESVGPCAPASGTIRLPGGGGSTAGVTFGRVALAASGGFVVGGCGAEVVLVAPASGEAGAEGCEAAALPGSACQAASELSTCGRMQADSELTTTIHIASCRAAFLGIKRSPNKVASKPQGRFSRKSEVACEKD